MIQQQPIYVFSHIPKTAGTTLNYLLRAFFKESLMSAKYRFGASQAAYRYEDFVKDKRIFPSLKCMSGHSLKPFKSFKEYDSQMVWLTFLRKPEKRFISHYIHQYTGDMSKYQIDLIDWARKYNRKNWMVKMIAGEENTQKAIDIIEEKFKFIGFTEEFNTSLTLMKYELGWDDFNTYYEKPKMIIRDTSLKDNIYSHIDRYRECIDENNELDNHLYQYCLDHIWSKYSEKYKGIDLSIDTLETYNKEWGVKRFQLIDNFIYKPLVRLDNCKNQSK